MLNRCTPRVAELLCALALAGTVAIPAVLASAPARAADGPDRYPNRPVRVVVTAPAGSGADVVMRPVAERLAEQLGKPVLIENRPGGNNVIGMNAVAKAPADGYMLLLATTALVITPALVPNMPFDPVKDLAPIALLGTTPLLLLANPKTGITNVRELIDRARSRPGTLDYSSSGSGGALHLGMELLNAAIGTRIRHIPYKGSPDALLALVTGDVQVALNTFEGPVLAQVTAGKVLALGMTGRSRMESQPQIPTIAESGIPGFEVVSWHGMLAPGRTPAEIVNRLETEVIRALQAPAVLASLKARSMQVEGRGAAAFATFIAKELEKWPPIVKSSGATAD